MKAESYLLFVRMQEMPKGVYDKVEEAWESDEFGTFQGGLGAVMIVRYSETPVGTSQPTITFKRSLSNLTCLQPTQLYNARI
jgi:hypothetical protein